MPDSSVLEHEPSFDRTARLQEVTLVNTAEGLSTLQQGSREVIVLEDPDVPIRSKTRPRTEPDSAPEDFGQIMRDARSQKRRNTNGTSLRSGLQSEPQHEPTRNTRRHHRRAYPTDKRSRGGTGTQKARDTVETDTRKERHRRGPRRKHESPAATGTKTVGAGTTSKRRTGHFEQGVRPRQKPERSLDITKTSRPTRKVTSTTWRIDFGVEQHIKEYSSGEETELNHAMTEGASRKVGPKESQSRWLKGRLQFGNTQIDSKHEKPKADRLTTRPGNRTDTNHKMAKMTSVIDLVRESQNTAEQGIGHYERGSMYSTWRDYEKKLKSYARELEAYETSKRERASTSNWWSKKSKSRSHRPHEPFPPPKELSVESYKDLRDTLYIGYDASQVDPTSQILEGWRKSYPKWAIKGRDEDEEESRKFPPLSRDTSPLSEAFAKLMVTRADIKGETLNAPSLPEQGADWKPVSKGAPKELQAMYKEQSRVAERTETESSAQEDEDAPYPPPGTTPEHRKSKRRRATKTHTRRGTQTKPTKYTQTSKNIFSGLAGCLNRILKVKDNVTTRSRTWQTVAPTEKGAAGETATKRSTGVEARFSYPRKGSKGTREATREATKTHKRGPRRKR